MDVFLTGASGYVGGVIAEHLRAAGHGVYALARSDRATNRVLERGAIAVRGDLYAENVLREAAEHADAVIHTAVDYTDPAMAAAEAAGLQAMLAGAADKPFIYTSTGLVYPNVADTTMTEDHPIDEQTSAQPHKVAGERTTLTAHGVKAMVLRAPLVHGRGGSGLLRGLWTIGRTTGIVPYIGDGLQAWSAVHVDDLAELFTLAIQQPHPGAIFNATAPDTFAIRDLAETIAQRTGATAKSLSPAEAFAISPALAVLGRAGTMDGTRAQSHFGWQPRRPALLTDLLSDAYPTT
jgi:nucleoside-diphosphate-sugar epimerase